MRAELLLAAALALAASPAAGRTRAPKVLPGAHDLLVKAFSAPKDGYAARGRIQYFAPGRKPRGMSMTVEALPDGRTRCERRRSPKKPAELIRVDDGREVGIYWPKLKTLWSGPSRPESAEVQAARFESLYRIAVSTGGRVAKRPTWRLDCLSPEGALRRSLWVGRADGLLLKVETFRLDGSLARRERYLRVDDGAADPARMSLDVPPGTAAARLNAPRGAAAPGAAYPGWVPEGYLPLSVAADGTGLSVVYGDGVGTFTVREFPRAGAPPRGRALALSGGGSAVLFAQAGAPALAFSSGSRSFVVSGALAEDELARVAESLEARP